MKEGSICNLQQLREDLYNAPVKDNIHITSSHLNKLQLSLPVMVLYCVDLYHN